MARQLGTRLGVGVGQAAENKARGGGLARQLRTRLGVGVGQ